jgi:hypothetical protein
LILSLVRASADYQTSRSSTAYVEYVCNKAACPLAAFFLLIADEALLSCALPGAMSFGKESFGFFFFCTVTCCFIIVTLLKGNAVRDLKAAKAAKADVDAGVAALKALKEEYKKLTGHDVPAAAPAAAPAKAAGTLSDALCAQYKC